MSELHVPLLPEPDPNDLVRELEREEAAITKDLVDAELRRPSIRKKIREELVRRLQPFVVIEGSRDAPRQDDVHPATHEERVAYVLARPEAGVRELARQLGVAPSTVTRIRRKHATPSATPTATPIATAVAQSEALAAATDVAVEQSAAEQITEHQRRLAGPSPSVKRIAPVPQPRLYFNPEPSAGEEIVNIGTVDLYRDRIVTGPEPGRRRRKPPENPFTPYSPTVVR